MASNKKSPRAKKGKKKKNEPQRKYHRLIFPLILLSILLFSLLAAGYVIFFRTVVAGELQLDGMGREEGLLEASRETGEPPKADLPKVAIIIDDLGYDEEIAMAFFNLPIEFTCSFLPFAPHTRQLERLAHRKGKGVFLHLPLEPNSSTFNPGEGALFLRDSRETKQEKLINCLKEVPHASGINTHMGSSFTENRLAMENIMEVIGDRSLIFVDSYTTPKTVGLQVAREAKVKSFARSVFLDNEVDEEKICGQLEKLVLYAERNGIAVGIAHPHKKTLAAVTGCSDLYSQRVKYVSLGKVLAPKVRNFVITCSRGRGSGDSAEYGLRD